MGLAMLRDALRVGLDVMLIPRGNCGYALVIVGEEPAELAVEEGIAMGIAIGSRAPLGLGIPIGEPADEWESRRYDRDGDTARRFELLG